MSKHLAKGDLSEIIVTEHQDDPKRYAIFGRFKGYRKKHILARVGEGEGDHRSAKDIKTTADIMAGALKDHYADQAFLRARARAEAEHIEGFRPFSEWDWETPAIFGVKINGEWSERDSDYMDLKVSIGSPICHRGERVTHFKYL
jgi:hypothetical protein